MTVNKKLTLLLASICLSFSSIAAHADYGDDGRDIMHICIDYGVNGQGMQNCFNQIFNEFALMGHPLLDPVMPHETKRDLALRALNNATYCQASSYVEAAAKDAGQMGGGQ